MAHKLLASLHPAPMSPQAELTWEIRKQLVNGIQYDISAHAFDKILRDYAISVIKGGYTEESFR